MPFLAINCMKCNSPSTHVCRSNGCTRPFSCGRCIDNFLVHSHPPAAVTLKQFEEAVQLMEAAEVASAIDEGAEDEVNRLIQKLGMMLKEHIRDLKQDSSSFDLRTRDIVAKVKNRTAALKGEDVGIFMNYVQGNGRETVKMESLKETFKNCLFRIDMALDSYISPFKFNQKKGEIHRNQGREQMDQQNWKEALKEFRKSRDVFPQAFETHFYIGWCLEEIDKSFDAISDYKRATLLKPDHTQSWFNLGLIQASFDKRSEAIKLFTKAINLKKDHRIFVERGRMYANQGALQQSLKDYTEAFNIHPSQEYQHLKKLMEAQLQENYYQLGQIN